jgi:NIPSNAP
MKPANMIVLLLAAAAMAFAALRAAEPAEPDQGAKKAELRIFELRTYIVPDGKMDALHARFRDITCKYFEKHGMTVVGFWNPTDPKEARTKLVYLLAHPSEEVAKKNWKALAGDADFRAAFAATEKDGKLVDKVESVYLQTADYSPLK